LLNRSRLFLILLLLCTIAAPAQTKAKGKASKPRKPAAVVDPLVDTQHVCARCLRSTLEFLASDAMRGRGSATHDELVAATYIAAQLQQYGVPPAFDKGYLQTAELDTPTLAQPSTLVFPSAGQTITWTHGKEFFLSRSSGKSVSGPLQKLPAQGGKPNAGAVVYWAVDPNGDPRAWAGQAFRLLQSGAAAVMIVASKQNLDQWDSIVKERPRFQREVVDAGTSAMRGIERDFIALRPEAAKQIEALPDGTPIQLNTRLGEPKREYTTNVVAVLHGTEADADKDVILLTAHLDHLGQGASAEGAPPTKDDDIYNGACDDASGTATVLEFARALATGPKPKRTVLFALFGSEELGGLGSTYFLSHSPIPLADIAANLEFEMLAWPDPKLGHDQLWITGWDRTNLEPELVKHGANLAADPYPAQNFFERSDNYILAKKGVVAQTIGSFGLQPEYHSVKDDLDHVDWDHYTKAVDSLIVPVQWLVNSNFKPQWLEGKKP
jgi:hypothetical protein